jgi:hypothetical protein
MNNNANGERAAIDSDPPIALDKFIEQSGLSVVTIWRYRRAGWLNTLNICGRHYLTRSEIARFNARAAAGEFAKQPIRPRRRRRCKHLGNFQELGVREESGLARPKAFPCED